MEWTSVNVTWALRPASALYVGGGPSGPGLDKSTVLDQDGRPLLPGSSLKGRLRHRCERIARALDVYCCAAPVAERMCPHYWGGRDDAPPPIEGSEHLGPHCPLCLIFGSPWWPSPLSFSDTKVRLSGAMEGEEDDVELTALRTGVSINRRLGTAQDKKLFVTRTGAPGLPLVYRGTATGRLPADKGLEGLLFAGLLDLDRVAGDNSRGLGWVDTGDIDRVRVTVGADATPMDREALSLSLLALQCEYMRTNGERTKGAAVR